MCQKCFNTEYSSFPSEQDWLDFDLELSEKIISANGLKQIRFISDGKRDKDDGEYVYQCQSCQTIWKLKDPDYAIRGYFLKVESNNPLLNTSRSGEETFWRIGILTFIIISFLAFMLLGCQKREQKTIIIGDYSEFMGVDTTKKVIIDTYLKDLDNSGTDDSLVLGNLNDLIGDPQLFTFVKLITAFQTVEIRNIGGFKIDQNSIIEFRNQIESEFIFIAKTKTNKTLAFIWDFQYPDCTNNFEIYSIGQNEIFRLFSENVIVKEIADSESENNLILIIDKNCGETTEKIEVAY